MIPKTCLLAVIAVLVVNAGVSTAASNNSVAKTGRVSGVRFFSWLTEHLPELSVKLLSCVKQEQRSIQDVLTSLATDTGRCFDEGKGSVLATIECLLHNSVGNMINGISVIRKVIICTVKHINDYRLCVSVVKTEAEGSCPFTVGV